MEYGMTSTESVLEPTPNQSQRWLEIGFLVLVAVLTFGIFIHRFGIYLDDWVTVYILERLSFWHLLDLTQGQSRPIYAVLMSMVGTDPLVSHAVTLGFLIVNLLLIRGLLRLIWPRIGVLATVIAALYAVYPGYWFRTASMALITEISLTMALVSWILAIYSVRWRGWRRYVAAAVSMLLIPLYVLTYELPVGVEALRPLLFWALLPAATHRERLRRALIHWWPWGLTLVAVVLYRLVIFEPTGFYDIVNHNALARPDLVSLVRLFLLVIPMQLVGVWFDPLNSVAFQDVGGLLIGAILGMGALALMLRRSPLKDMPPSTRSLIGMLLVGLMIMVLGQATQVITMKPPLAVGWLTRWNQISMLGVVLIWCSLIMLISHRLLRQRAVLLIAPAFAFLIAAGGVVHVRIGSFYVDDWDAYRSLWWQLAEAAPYIADDTTLLLEFPDLEYIRQRAFWPPAYQGMVAADLFFDNPRVTALHYTSLPEFAALGDPDTFEIDNGNWSFSWRHFADRQVLLRMVDGCLQVVDPAHLDRYSLSRRVRAIAETLAPDPRQFFVEVPDGKTFPYRHLFGPPLSSEGCPSPFAIPGD
jgi:hypothetical protein